MAAKNTKLFCENVSFGCLEDYKRLRTNVRFCLPVEFKCPVVGISSAQPGEGKSLTSINLAFSFAQLKGKNVILIDCDMRRPSIAEKLDIRSAPGLSNLLSDVDNIGNSIITYTPTDASESFHIIPAGNIPPNPSELLQSERMGKLIQKLQTQYDYIFLDLPPVVSVTDAQSLSQLIDGLLIVVREGFCTRPQMDECINQLRLAGVDILGFVLNGSIEATKSSYKYKKYSGNYHSYDRSYIHQPAKSDETIVLPK